MENPFELIYDKLNAIENLLKSQIIKEIKIQPETVINEYLTIDEASVFVCQSKSSMYKKTMDCVIPHYKVGKKLLFKRSELIEWIEEYRVKSKTQLLIETNTGLKRRKNRRV